MEAYMLLGAPSNASLYAHIYIYSSSPRPNAEEGSWCSSGHNLAAALRGHIRRRTLEFGRTKGFQDWSGSHHLPSTQSPGFEEVPSVLITLPPVAPAHHHSCHIALAPPHQHQHTVFHQEWIVDSLADGSNPEQWWIRLSGPRMAEPHLSDLHTIIVIRILILCQSYNLIILQSHNPTILQSDSYIQWGYLFSLASSVWPPYNHCHHHFHLSHPFSILLSHYQGEFCSASQLSWNWDIFPFSIPILRLI